MNQDKSLLIESLLERVNNSPYLFVVDYTGLTVEKFSELRKRLKANDAEMHVYKNTFVRKASEKAGYPAEVAKHLTGQTAVVTGAKDVYASAKILKTFATEFEKPKLRVGVIDNQIVEVEAINKMASLPTKEVLLSQLLGVLLAPGSALARALKAKAEKDGGTIESN
jgi:large subunit ribosomal protein L10